MEFLVGLIGLILGVGVAWLFLLVSARSSFMLYPIAGVFGGLGSLSADQLLSYGPTLLGIMIVPVVVGSIVLALVAICGFYLFKRAFLKLRDHD